MGPHHPFNFVDGHGLDSETAYRLIVGCVVPRPVAWITTMDSEGRVNAAPFSSYNYVATHPPMVAVNIASRTGVDKDTARNLRATGEMVINVATEQTMELMHRTSAEYPSDVSETEILGLELLESRRVKVPRIAITPVQLECKLEKIVPLGSGLNTLFIAEVVAFHLSDQIYDGRRVDSVGMRPIARLGGPFYASLGEIHQYPMPPRPPAASTSTLKPKDNS